MKIWKEVISPGCFWYTDPSTGQPLDWQELVKEQARQTAAKLNESARDGKK